MDHLSLSCHPKGDIQARVKFPSGALATGLSTGALHGDQTPTEEGVFMNDLGESGAGFAFWIGQVVTGAHGGTSFLISIIISDSEPLSSPSLNANLLTIGRWDLTRGIYRGFSNGKFLITESLGQ
jgi:hypothetical protein